MERIELAEKHLKEIQAEATEILKQHMDLVKTYMSLTGIGPMNSLALLAHLGNFERFSKAKQVSNFVGLTPRVDQSGDKTTLGRISKRGCKQVRRVIVQGAWATVRSAKGGRLKEKFLRIAARSGTRMAIITIAREMMELLFYMVELYREVTQTQLQRKLKIYGLI
jgi:transposase